MTRAALIINDLGGGDYQVVLVDEERFKQIAEIVESTNTPGDDTTDLVLYLIGPAKEASTAREQRPDLYPECRGQVLGEKFAQDLVIELSEDWPAVHIFSILTVPGT